jgi:hypothetical protein
MALQARVLLRRNTRYWIAAIKFWHRGVKNRQIFCGFLPRPAQDS